MANPAKAQNRPETVVTIDPQTLKLKEVFTQLTEKAGLNFIYTDIDKELEKTITLTPAISSIRNILEQLSAKTGLKFSATGDDIKANNLSNQRYFSGWAAIVPQMPRNFILDFSLKFGGVK